jgi:PAS domain S-box-containing protein
LAVDAILLLECGPDRARYRVVWVDKGTECKEQVGLQCIDAGKNIFGLEAPQAGSFYDEYKRVEAELQRSENRYRRLFENSLGLICIHDPQGVILSVNPAAASALGHEPGAIAGKRLSDFLAPSVRSQFPQYLKRIQTSGHDSGHMLVVWRDRIKRIWFYRNLLVREDGKPPYVIGHAMDVTDQKNTERELQSALAELQKALAEVRTLKGLLPICAWCKKIRTEAGDWTDLESYITENSDAHFSHGVCSECLPKLKSGPLER